MQAYMLGSATSALSNVDGATAARREHLDQVKQYVRYKKVPMFLRVRVIEYYEYPRLSPNPLLAVEASTMHIDGIC
eukprot:5191549-Prymnesium_polylepis.2